MIVTGTLKQLGHQCRKVCADNWDIDYLKSGNIIIFNSNDGKILSFLTYKCNLLQKYIIKSHFTSDVVLVHITCDHEWDWVAGYGVKNPQWIRIQFAHNATVYSSNLGTTIPYKNNKTLWLNFAIKYHRYDIIHNAFVNILKQC